MQIRRMTLDDCTEVAKIEKESFSMPWSEKAFLDTVSLHQYYYLVAEDQGKIIGYCGFVFALDEGEIPNVCVASQARRRGVGRAMLQELFLLAKEYHLTKLFLEVRQSNVAARRLYEATGFEQIGIRKGFYELPKEDAVLMQRIL